MANKKRISPAERRHQDYLRRNGLKVGKVYEARLLKLRNKEVNRLLSLCKDCGTDQWANVIDTYCNEQYLWDWYKGLYVDAGLPRAKSTARDLSRGKATPDEGYWEDELIRYAGENAGDKIVLVQDTFKDELVSIVRTNMQIDAQLPIEKLARKILHDYKDIALWQARRIAQTETMISLAGAGDIAARSLDVKFSKQWAISGLGNTRDSHLEMDGVIVYDADEPFVLPSGELMMYPHDSSLGASAGEIINCACDVIRRPI